MTLFFIEILCLSPACVCSLLLCSSPRCKNIPFKEIKSKEKDNESNRSFRSLNTANSTLSSLTVRMPPTLEETLEFFDIFFDMVEIARIR